MKRKIFSKLLMVALVIAAVGSFVSCKDYDDDINNLQKQIDAKAAISELTALQSTLESKISTATAAAQKAAEDAAAKADASLKADLEKAIADAKKAGTDAGTKAGEAITAANKAQETADAAAQAAKDADAAAKKDLADALKTIEETYQTKAEAAAAATEAAKALADVKAIADAAFTKAEAEKLQEQVNNLKADLEAAIDEKIDEKIKEVNNAVASVDAIWAAITGIELYGTLSGSEANFDDVAQALAFLHGQIKLNSIFGNNEDISNQQGEPFATFSDKDSIRVENVILVKVNPINATLTKDQIKLIDSEGNDLDDFVVVGEPYAYKTLITRAGDTGLWAVPVSQSSEVKQDEFNAQTIVGYNKEKEADPTSLKYRNKHILYAVAVNNTKDAAAARYVTTTFDLSAYSAEYTPATTLRFTVNGEADVKNRWNGATVVAEDDAESIKNPELAWGKADKDKGIVVPDTAATNEKAVKLADDDIRINSDFVDVALGEEFVVKMTDTKKVQWFYVVFDEANAIESAPSELRAWQSYEDQIEGLGVMTKATSPLKMVINAKKASHDIIGFRVYAVNYDGTLADPDGKAFYVRVDGAKAANTATVAADVTWTATQSQDNFTAPTAATKLADWTNASAVYDLDIEEGFETLAFAGPATVDVEVDDDNKATIYGDQEVYYTLLDEDGKAVDDWADAKKIKVAVNNPGEWKNTGAAIAVTIEGKKGDVVINSISLNLKKAMPDNVVADGDITIKSGADYTESTNTLNIYMAPTVTNFGTATSATRPLWKELTKAQIEEALTVSHTPNNIVWYKLASYGVADIAELIALKKLTADGESWQYQIASAKTVITTDKNADEEEVAWDKDKNPYKLDTYKITPDEDGKAYIQLPAADIRDFDKTNAAEWKTQAARWTSVIGGASKTMNIKHIYAGISATASNKKDQDYEATAKSINVNFIDPVAQKQTNEARKYYYATGLSSDGKKNVWNTSTAFAVPYATIHANADLANTTLSAYDKSTILPGESKYVVDGVLSTTANASNTTGIVWYDAAPAAFADYSVSNAVADFILVKNSYYSSVEKFGYLFGVAGGGLTGATQYNSATAGIYVGSTFAIGGSYSPFETTLTPNDYFNVYVGSDGKLKTSIKADAPAVIDHDINSTLTIKARTAFGNVVTVGSINIIITKD